jgi:Flp pilus assembly pilin Flp
MVFPSPAWPEHCFRWCLLGAGRKSNFVRRKRVMNVFNEACVRLRESKGQTMAEYSLIVSLVAVVTVTAWGICGGKITDTINAVAVLIP